MIGRFRCVLDVKGIYAEDVLNLNLSINLNLPSS